MNNNHRYKRKNIEIYFILYLTALILLIPDTKKNEFSIPNSDSLTNQIPFELKPEKSNLSLILMPDSNGIKQISFDSTNKIYYTGNSSDVEFEFIVEDITYNRKIDLKPNDNTSDFFNIKHFKNERYVEFIWTPEKKYSSNQQFNVVVKADFMINNEIISKRTEFSLNKTYINSSEYVFVVNNSDSFAIASQIRNSIINNNIISSSIGEIILIPTEYNIKTVAFSNWSNVINVSGIDLYKDLLKNPEINIERTPKENNGNAKILEIENNKIIIGGKAPDYGSMSVKLSITRQIDLQEATVEFSVLPQPVGMPELPNYMYPDKLYILNPNLPDLTGQIVSSAIVDEKGKVIAENKTGREIKFIPKSTFTGKTLYFERYIDGELFGQKYPIVVKDYPSPSFSRVQKIDENKIRVFTVSYGLYNDEENFIKDIEIKGNAVYTEIIGQAKFDKTEMVYYQVFEFKRKENNRPFTFTAKAINVKGEATEILQYP